MQKSSYSSMMEQNALYALCPRGVGRMPVAVRMKSCESNSFSRFCICLLRTDWVMNSFRAAWHMLPSSTTATNSRKYSICIEPPVLFRAETCVRSGFIQFQKATLEKICATAQSGLILASNWFERDAGRTSLFAARPQALRARPGEARPSTSAFRSKGGFG